MEKSYLFLFYKGVINVAEDWRDAGYVQDPKAFEPVGGLQPGIRNSTSEKKFEGSDNDRPLESFEQCKHVDYNYSSKEHPIVKHKCKYADIYNRCTRDECIFDADETSKICNKHWETCILCGNVFTVPPNMMDVRFCDKCRGRLLFSETLPFTCLLCGQKQDRPSKAPFSQICDDCFQNYIFCPNCMHWRQVGISPAEGYDKL